MTSLFAFADPNRDCQISADEMRVALADITRAATQTNILIAHTDNSGMVSRFEFERSLLGQAMMAFDLVDANGDGQLSPQEA